MKPRINILLSAILITITLTSAVMFKPLQAQKPEPPPQGDKHSPPRPDLQFNGTYISWDKQENTTQENWNWRNQAWEFGPYPTFHIYLSNGTEITDANFIPVGATFKAVVYVQKNVFTGNSTLGRAGLQWNTELRSQNGTNIGNANLKMVYINQMQTHFWNETNAWHVESFVFNNTAQSKSPPPMEGPQPPPPPEQMKQFSFYNFNKNASTAVETAQDWQITFVGFFNTTTTPMGPYWMNLEVTDQYDSWIEFGFRARLTQEMATNRMVAVGTPGLAYGWFQDTWAFERLDMENQPLYSASKGQPWKMRINVTGSELTNVTVGMELGWNVKTYVNVTNWYSKPVTTRGGWMFNETSGTYYWNSTVEVTRAEQVFGPHPEERWINVNHNRQVNITRQFWDPITGQARFINETMPVQEKMFLIYDHYSHTFTVKQGYSYMGYDPQLQRDREYMVLNDLNASDPTTRFYQLSPTDSNWYQTGSDKYAIEFVGYFSNETFTDRDAYWFQISVYTRHGQIWPRWENTNPGDFQIAVDRLVAISTVLNPQGRPFEGWMFQTDPSESFTIQSKLYGTSVSSLDIDGVGVVFRTGVGRWAVNESFWSDVEIRLTKDLTTGVLSAATYNRTNRNAYVYGTHLGWALVNVTDWHTQFNSSTGMWDWVQSPQLRWNETIVTDWHWENFRLNQTEYARAPTSPKIWIDTTKTWVSEFDPAFKMPASYANVHSAEITQVKGVVTINLNVSFSPAAPESNYQWNMLFQNLTYGRDWSQGWGEHTITEWTNEPVYFVNGSATNWEAWYVSKPLTPLSTIYDGRKYLLNQLPYITLNGADLPIQVRSQYDSMRQEEWTQYLLYEPYNPSLGMQPRYYELLNGTKIYVKEAFQAVIRAVTLNCTDAYQLAGSNKIPVTNGTVFKSYMDRSKQDWAVRFWDPVLQREIAPFYYELLDGSRIYRNDPFEMQMYNSTRNRWELTARVYTEEDTPLPLSSVGSGVALNGTVVLLREPSNWQPMPDGSGYFLVMRNGTRITITDPWSVPDDQRFVILNGLRYLIDWPNQYYTGTHEGHELMIRGGGMEGYVRNFYYTDLGVEDGVKYEMPYSNAMATSWWELEDTESEGRKLKTTKSLTVNGVEHVIYQREDGSHYIVVDSTQVSVTPPEIDYGYYYSSINGQEYWDVIQKGWILQYGKHNERSGQITASGAIITTTGRDPVANRWTDWNRYGYDRENSTLYIQMSNGSRFDLHSSVYVAVWKVQVGDQIFYTTDANDRFESMVDNQTAQTINLNYITSLDGQKIYFNWNDKPANWLEEIHIQVPGTNFTRLIPFSWQAKQVFDTIYVYNLTIPGLAWDPAHTDVFYEDGTEVSVNATLKVWGTSGGPGVYHGYFWENDSWTPNSWFVPGTNAPWNNGTWVNYMTMLNGTQVYSTWGFGWVGDHWGVARQWTFINDDPVAGNRTAQGVEGYRVYLNDTLPLDVTTQNPMGGMPGQHLVMKNGTIFNVHWRNELSMYFTRIGDQDYYFRNVVMYYTINDLGESYDVYDDKDFDIFHIVTPSVVNAPVATLDRQAWLWMNSTTDRIMRDGLGWYLLNASDFSRTDLSLVDGWWNLSDAVRGKVFTGELSDCYPRFNVTINGREFFVIDPSPVISRFEGEGQIENSLYRYPSSVTVNLEGTDYTVVLFDNAGWWRQDIRWKRVETVTIDGNAYELERSEQWKPSYNVIIDSQLMDVQQARMNIFKTHKMWGDVYGWMLTDLNIVTQRQINDIVVGVPNWGMWGVRAFDVVPETGALDLDGDLTTTGDQYFVRRIHGGSDLRNVTINRMWVEIIWDPNSSLVEDEIHIGAWMGKMYVAWTSEWNETYIWHYASNMTTISEAAMQNIRSVIVDGASKLPKPGYWDIAHMVKNATWADMLERAKREGWNWITDKTNEWEWMWFGTQQDYTTSWATSNGTEHAGIGLRYEFAGLSLYNGTEKTHFFMPRNIGNITFVTPGEMFGNTNATGDMVVPLNAKIAFGVTYNGVNGTLFPYSEQRSMWGWWDRPVFGADFNVPNFMNKPTPSLIDQVSFAIHFNGTATPTAEANNEASIKIDQHIGNWAVDPGVIDGRQQNVSGVLVPLVGKDIFLNRSLATNYYVTAFSGIAWNVMDDKGTAIDNNNSTESSRFSIASRLANVQFATVKLGSTYDWEKPITDADMIRTFNVTSKTSPIGSFKASFQSESGKSSTGFDISASMYFLTVGFDKWDGYAVYNDPEVLFLLSKGVTPQTEPFILLSEGGLILLFVVGSLIATATVLVVFRKRVKSKLSQLWTKMKSAKQRKQAKSNRPEQPSLNPFEEPLIAS
ncbi:MAG TPA: hypothetical protein VJ249_06540 [Candidatus Bathyarchaeia archaeon]|nr:hypothetical protein [Candidatus Bathyarchaeia archaeon]